MRDLFTELIERSRGALPVVRPRLPGRFEPTGLDFTDSEKAADFRVDPSSQSIAQPIPSPNPMAQLHAFKEVRPPTPIEVQTRRPRAKGNNSKVKGVSDDHRDTDHPPPPELPKPMKATPTLPSKPASVLNPHAALGKDEPLLSPQAVPSSTPPAPTLAELMTPTAASDPGPASPSPSAAGNTAANESTREQSRRSHAMEPRRKPERKSTPIEVRIGSIEVRAAKPAPLQKTIQKSSRQGPRISLNDYLQHRNRKKR